MPRKMIFEPSRVHAICRLQERRVRERRFTWQLLQAAYLTRFWEHVGLMGDASRWGKWNINGTEIEVNRLWRGVMTYKSSLYRRSNRVELGPDPVGDRGDPVVGGIVANALWQDDRLAERLDRLVGMSLLFPGSGIKVGVDEGRGPPMRRVWTRAVPWWELVLDSDCGDAEDERYRGHRYWMPLEEAEDKYGCVGLRGRRRVDFLSDGKAGEKGDEGKESEDADGEFVEVLEWVNFKDAVKGRGGATYKGRFEVYVLGQSRSEYEGPVQDGPLPLADADGVGLSPVEALIFEHEPAYPLRGVAPAERVLPQLREYNVLRTKLAELVRRNARKHLRRKGILGDDQLDKLYDGTDGTGAEIDAENVALTDVIYNIPPQSVPVELWNWLGIVDSDYSSAWGQIAPAQGKATDKGKTAYANQIEQFWTESEVGYHGNVLTTFSRKVVKLLLRATAYAMSTVGDAAGAVADLATGAVDPGRSLVPVGSVPGEEGVVPEVVSPSGDTGAAVEAVDAGEAAVAGGDAEAVAQVEVPGAVKVEYVAFSVRDPDRRLHVVTREALDADFEVKFLEGARTPLTDAAVAQYLAGSSEQYFGWFGLVLEGGPMAVLARAWMQAVADRMQLPPELHVAALEVKAKKAEEAKPPPPPPEQQQPPVEAEAEEEPRAEAGAVDQVVFALRSIVDAVASLSSVDPEAASAAGRMVAAAVEAAGAGDVAGVVQAAGAALEALSPLAEKVEEGTPGGDALREAATVLSGLVRAGASPVVQ